VEVAAALNPWKVRYRPTNASQTNSGAVAMLCHMFELRHDTEQDGDSRSDEQPTSDEAEQRHLTRHQAGPVHQVAQHHPVVDTDDEAGTEQEGLERARFAA
jgi:hypothetical protein